MTDIKMTAFEIISYAGDAKSSAYEALEAAKQNDHAGYEAKMEEAENKINEAHKAQYAMLQEEAAGQMHAEFSIIVVHARSRRTGSSPSAAALIFIIPTRMIWR